MKKIILYFLAIFIVVSVLSTSCRSTTVITTGPSGSSGQHIPPGQMKKMTGEKSAKNHAPGQQKKKNKH